MKRVITTLLEQMKISDAEISDRKALLGLTEEALTLLSNNEQVIAEHLEMIVADFYEKQTEIDEITLLIRDADTLSRLSNAQRHYVTDLFSGVYDSNYVNNRLRIGLVHKRIGVEPKLYLSAIKTLKDILFNVLRENIDDKEVLYETLEVLDKLFYFDTTLVFDTYIDSLVGEIKSAQRKSEEYAKTLERKVVERTLQLEEQAKLDSLTGLYNQRVLYDFLKRELALAKRRQTDLSLVYFDIDNFKTINDKEGHMYGDEVLSFVGDILLGSVRETDIACRYGGDEFCLVLPECDTENAKIVSEKIIEKFVRKYPSYSLSVGIAMVEEGNYIDRKSFIKNADQKMYQAKKEVGSFICV